ncbi:MAG: amidinotransferase [Bacteroidetes bacterium]|nr:amidinotransferase [Bacteroidota bacterium]
MISEQTPEKLLRQFSSHIMMVRPVRFAYNTQTAEDNAFMHKVKSLDSAEIQTKALAEFEMFVAKLKEVGIRLTIFDDRPEPHTPDSIFPNNWISFHQNEKIIIYPIKAENRRLEKRKDIVETLSKLYPNPEVIDWSEFEEKELFLEGTGSLVLDRYHEIAYACISQRTHQEVLDAFCQLTGYKPVAVHGFDQDGEEIYHTNVMMGLGIGFAVVCLDAVRDPEEKLLLQNSLESTGFEIIPLTFHQMNNFAGNLLQVMAEDGTPYVILSQRAYDSLTDSQLAVMRRNSKVLPVPLDIIEVIGGGSVRCMMTEIFES